jgi:hypothetical protein
LAGKQFRKLQFNEAAALCFGSKSRRQFLDPLCYPAVSTGFYYTITADEKYQFLVNSSFQGTAEE